MAIAEAWIQCFHAMYRLQFCYCLSEDNTLWDGYRRLTDCVVLEVPGRFDMQLGIVATVPVSAESTPFPISVRRADAISSFAASVA